MPDQPSLARAAFIAAVLLAATPLAPAAEPQGFGEARAAVTMYCGRCHGETAQKGGVNLAPFADEKAVLRQRKLWRSVAEQLKSGDMPPDGQKQPTKDERDRVVGWITLTLDAADALDRTKPDPGASVVRRLTRAEYDNTVRDLLGVRFDLAAAVGMPDDTTGDAFDNLAAALAVSDSLMEKYFAAADLAVEKLYETAPRKGQRPKPGTPPTPFEVAVPVRPAWFVPPRAAARVVAATLARRAYRRPVEPRDVDRLLTLFDKQLAAGATFDTALKPVIKAVLVSPNFLLRVERNRAADPDAACRVGDHELAVRLSYFLWSSMPDAELSATADHGELSKPDVYEKQVRRMVADPKARALTVNFAAQWLQLRKLPDARPSTEFFPTFTPRLRRAMADEAATFFDHLRTENRPVTDLLDADYTYLNDELAKHYGIKGKFGPELQRVKLDDPNRGGLLGMGAVLAVTSHTNRTSPTLRGKYVLDVVLGTPPPPPPPNVSQIDEAKGGKEAKTFRELLAVHATNATCAGCHKKIDPLGFGLENFDPVGRFRPSGKGIDATGQLPGGEAFDGPRGLKQVLLKRQGRFVENMTEKLLAYALGRELAPTDAAAVKGITADLAKHENRFETLVLGVVRSYPFQHRRNLKADETP